MYVPRLSAPARTEELLFSDKNFFTKHGYPMNNCTTYVWGEWMRRYKKSIGCRGCAGGWIWEVEYRNLGWEISKTPVLGSVGVWKIKGAKLDGVKTPGHVAIPEQIKNNANIITSNSAYEGTMFYLQELKACDNYYWKSNITGKEYELQGFICPPTFQTEPKATYICNNSFDLMDENKNTFKALTTSQIGDSFMYDGVYRIVNEEKWLHGRLVKKSGVKPDLAGWASAKYLK